MTYRACSAWPTLAAAPPTAEKKVHLKGWYSMYGFWPLTMGKPVSGSIPGGAFWRASRRLRLPSPAESDAIAITIGIAIAITTTTIASTGSAAACAAHHHRRAVGIATAAAVRVREGAIAAERVME